MAQQSHHLLQRGNLKVDVFQLLPHQPGRVEQLESNIAVLSPSLQKHQHAQTSAAYGVHFREVQDYDAGVCLGRNGVAQFECTLSADKSAGTLNDRHVTYVIDMYAWHLSSEQIVI
jgi:hypothetical protein